MKKQVNWYCADFETTSKEQYEIEGSTRVYLWEMVNGNTRKKYLGVSIQEFFETLEKIEDNSIIYFHNLNFDGEFIMWYLLENGYQDNEELGTKTFNSIIDETGSIYRINVMLKNNNKITFSCSYKLFPKSIKSIGEMVGIPKLNETHNYEELKNYKSIDELTEEELMYIDNDVQIMVALIKYLREVGVSGITMSSSAYKNWRSDKNKYFLSKNHMNKDTNNEIVEIVRKSYRGGITMINPKYVGVDIYSAMSFDVNSLYPSVMYDNDMPIGEGMIFNSIEDSIKAHRYNYIVVVVVTYANCKDGYHPFIGNNSGFTFSRQYSYDREIKNKVLYLWGKEYELFTKIYDGEYIIEKVVGWKTSKDVFKEYIDRWYAIKEKEKSETPLRQLAKLMLNSLYGKFGMNDSRISKIPVGVSDDKIIYKTDTTSSIYYYKEVASYITSMARVKLVTFLEMCGDDFIYCDTDSIYMKGETPPSFLNEFIHSSKRGYWKYEGHYTQFRGWKAKCYMKQLDDGTIKHSIAGCPKDTAKNFTFENFYPNIKMDNAKNVKRKVKGGIIIDKTSFVIHI